MGHCVLLFKSWCRPGCLQTTGILGLWTSRYYHKHAVSLVYMHVHTLLQYLVWYGQPLQKEEGLHEKAIPTSNGSYGWLTTTSVYATSYSSTIDIKSDASVVTDNISMTLCQCYSWLHKGSWPDSPLPVRVSHTRLVYDLTLCVVYFRIPPGNGSVLLSNVDCDYNSENQHILRCTYSSLINSCDHSQDMAIICCKWIRSYNVFFLVEGISYDITDNVLMQLFNPLTLHHVTNWH
jgi:hypothetical protein